jgi:DNA primase large subunit
LSESGDRLREKTTAQRLVIYKQLKAKAEMYQDLLGMRQDQVRAGIAGLEREALNLLISEAVPSNSATSQTPAPLFTESEFAVV